MKKSFLKLIALALTVLMLVSIPISSTAADEAAVLDVSDMYGEVLESSVQLKEIPLLIILVSFDANGNGQDDYDPSNTGNYITDKTAPLLRGTVGCHPLRSSSRSVLRRTDILYEFIKNDMRTCYICSAPFEKLRVLGDDIAVFFRSL